jgi:hypothetical protein
MKARFLDQLEICAHPCSDNLWIVHAPLRFYSVFLARVISVERGLVTDLASIPFHVRWCHREGVLHDRAYRTGPPNLSRLQADCLLWEAMEAQGKPLWMRIGFFLAVRLFGRGSYRKRTIAWSGR